MKPSTRLLLLLTSCLLFLPAFCTSLDHEQEPLIQPPSVLPSSSGNQPGRFNFSSPSPHLFASVHGLLQQWPNTFFPNGHSIVPCEIPPYTLLYHGRYDDADTPPSPEWLAFDIEMSYGITGSSRASHMLTYRTTRPVHCLYFDGASAALMGTGQLDSQMLVVYGNTTGAPTDNPFRGLFGEYDRAEGLCRWVREVGLDVEAFVRMNAGFEAIWCDFDSESLRRVGKINTTAPLLEEKPAPAGLDAMSPSPASIPTNDDNDDALPAVEDLLEARSKPSTTHTTPAAGLPSPPPGWDWNTRMREPFLGSMNWDWFVSATWHYGSSGMRAARGGEHRVKLHPCGFLSFYDPALESAAAARAGEERAKLNLTREGLWESDAAWNDTQRESALEQLTRRRGYHTLHNVSNADALLMRERAELVMRALGWEKQNQTSNDGFPSNNFDGRSQSPPSTCSGVDWLSLTDEIVQRYADRLPPLVNSLGTLERLLVNSSANPNLTSLRTHLESVRLQTHVLLMPFFEYPADLTPDSFSTDAPAGKAALANCRATYDLPLPLPDSHSDAPLAREEVVLRATLAETHSGICSVIIPLALDVEKMWFASGFNFFEDDADENALPSVAHDDEPHTLPGEDEIRTARRAVEELMAWLGWAELGVACDEVCAAGEQCFVPIWPVNFKSTGGGRGGRRGRPYHGGPPSGGGPPGRGGPPDGGHGRRPGSGRPGGGGPGFGPPQWSMVDDPELWKPRCMKPAKMYR